MVFVENEIMGVRTSRRCISGMELLPSPVSSKSHDYTRDNNNNTKEEERKGEREEKKKGRDGNEGKRKIIIRYDYF